MQRWRYFLGGRWVGIEVGPSNFKIGVGVGSGIAGADGPILKLERPTPAARPAEVGQTNLVQ